MERTHTEQATFGTRMQLISEETATSGSSATVCYFWRSKNSAWLESCAFGLSHLLGCLHTHGACCTQCGTVPHCYTGAQGGSATVRLVRDRPDGRALWMREIWRIFWRATENYGERLEYSFYVKRFAISPVRLSDALSLGLFLSGSFSVFTIARTRPRRLKIASA